MSNPWAQPPTAKDWLIQPSYPRHNPVPYDLASLWDSHYAHQPSTQRSRKPPSPPDAHAVKDRIARDLRRRLKHTRAARGLLQNLEEDIRMFVEKWNDQQRHQHGEAVKDPRPDADDPDSEDEIVFVGRNGSVQNSPESKQQKHSVDDELRGEKMVFDSLAHDRGGMFGSVSAFRSGT
jgi:ATP-dependent helicase YprA (DUF1998 family)